MIPIKFTDIQSNLPYASVSDIMALIGNVEPLASGDITPAQIQTAIVNASSYVDAKTNKFFSPRRIKHYADGNGQGKFQLNFRPLISINSLQICIAYPLTVSMNCSDWNLRIDRNTGTLSFPIGMNLPVLAPYSNTFISGSQNLIIDATYGSSRVVFGEVLSSKDNISYLFANPTGVSYSLTTTSLNSAPPQIYPTVYVNGVKVINTLYALDSQAAIYTTTVWAISQDNLMYSLITNAKGITGIKFNNPIPVGSIVTVDYPYWFIESDITDITAKKACISILAGIATSGGFQDLMYQGTVEIMLDGSRTRYNDTYGKFGHTISLYLLEIAEVIAQHRKIIAPYGLSSFGLH